MATRAKPPTPGGLGRRLRRRTGELAHAVAVLRDAVPQERRDGAYRAAVGTIEHNLADLQALGVELPGILNTLRRTAQGTEQPTIAPETEGVDHSTAEQAITRFITDASAAEQTVSAYPHSEPDRDPASARAAGAQACHAAPSSGG